MPQIDIKNIIQIIPNMEIGGAEKTVLEIGAYLKNTHYEPIVLTSGGGMIENLKEKKIKVLTRKIDQKNPYTIFTNIEKFKNIFLENKISLVHARSRAPAWSAYYASKKLNIPFITTWHGHAENSSFFKKRYNSIMLKGNAVIANSKYTAKKISENYSYDISNIDIIPRGVSSSDYTSNNFSEKEIIDLKRKWIIKDDQKVILLPARYSRWKGHELAIRACSKIVEENDNDFTLIQNLRDKVPYLIELINKQNLNEYIKIVTSFCFDANKYFNDSEPWAEKKKNKLRMNSILYTVLVQIKNISILLYPIIPIATNKVLGAMNLSNSDLSLNNITKKKSI